MPGTLRSLARAIAGGKLPGTTAAILDRLEAGTATWRDARNLAAWAGWTTGADLSGELERIALLSGQARRNALEQLLVPALRRCWELSGAAAQQVQAAVNQAAGLRLQAVKAGRNEDRIAGLVTELVEKEELAPFGDVLRQQTENFAVSVVDDTLRSNVHAHYRAGLGPRITRYSSGSCCAWCDALAGSYAYPDEVPDDLYRRHTNCDCYLEYRPSADRAQNVWTKQQTAGAMSPAERQAQVEAAAQERRQAAQKRREEIYRRVKK